LQQFSGDISATMAKNAAAAVLVAVALWVGLAQGCLPCNTCAKCSGVAANADGTKTVTICTQ
jgi:hypothetical protein